MNDIFASIFEWFGLFSVYSVDLGDHLRGLDITCSDYVGSPLYTYIGWIVLGTVFGFYVLIYHVINNPRFNKRGHWWVAATVLILINFLVAFGWAFKDLDTGNYCNKLHFSTADCVFFGLSVAFWSLLAFGVLTALPYPRRLAGYNMTETTLWKPK
ncbi:MAG: hypothetical protein HS105_05485 [Chloracidobacterium sp.]|nr:hypothetical protein [Chloracidobacterium sp.]